MPAHSRGFILREILFQACRIRIFVIACVLASALGAPASSQILSAHPDGPPTVLRGSGPSVPISPVPSETGVLRGTGPDPRELVVDMNDAPWRAVGKVIAAAGVLRSMCT